MKIGQFSKSFDVSVNTVRHYMDMGLLIPTKDGGQYHFDEQCQSDMTETLEMKALGFSLEEIRAYHFYKRISKMRPIEHERFYYNMLEKKMEEIQLEIMTLESSKIKLEHKLKDSNPVKLETKRKMGIPLDILPIFACPSCQEDLTLDCSEVTNNNVITGQLTCTCCSEVVEISQGILKSKGLIEPKDYEAFSIDIGPLTIEKYFAEYVKHTPAKYFENVYAGFKWCKSRMDFDEMVNKVVVEIGTGTGLFLRNIYDSLPKDVTYICVDYNHSLNQYLKELIESGMDEKKVIFISADFHSLPLKSGMVDYLIDITGTANDMLANNQKPVNSFLLEEIDYLFNPDTKLCGSYFVFEKYAKNHPFISINNREKFKAKYIDEGLAKAGFIVNGSFQTGYMPVGGKYEDFFVEGDKVYSYQIMATRNE